VFTGVNFRSYGQSGDTVVDELTVQQNNFSEIQNSGALSAGVQIFSLDASAPAVNEFDGILVRQNLLPSRKVNARGQINGINVGAVLNPADFSFYPTVINNLNAPGNFWNSASGPETVGSPTSGGGASIKLSPYISSYTDDPSKVGAPGFWPTNITNGGLTVCASGCTYTTIQSAINEASAGDTINVGAGTYTENVSINKALTILGPNNSIAPGTVATRVSEAVVSGAVTIASEINGATLRGFKITPSDNSNVGVSIGSKSRNVSVTYNDISGFNQGILSQGNSANFGSDMNISYNYLHDLLGSNTDYGSYGIHLRNVKELTLSNNIITGTVTGLTGTQYRRGMGLRGIQNAVIDSNTVSFGSTASAQATYAIFITQKLNDGDNGNDLAASNVVISGNMLSGVIWGINISELDSQARGIVVKENTVRKVFTGVNFRSYGQAGAAVVGELTVRHNDFSEIQNSGALVAAGILSAGVQVFSFDSSAPALNEFNGIMVQQNWLPSRT
jgi:hypothetical protein